ncbi:EIN3-binding F-box protein 1-like [Wolffia australiana]
MSALVNVRGEADIRRFMSLAHGGVYFPPHKRPRRCPPAAEEEQKQGFGLPESRSERVSLDSLPDECLFEVLRRVDGPRERSLAACVSKRWLHLLSSILPADVPSSVAGCRAGANTDAVSLARHLEGKEATDTRLVCMAVGAALRGGVSELFIRGSNASRPATDLGLGAVARASPSLRVLSLWNAPSITDEGLAQIADRCPLLEKLDLCGCASISDRGLAAVADKCPRLASLVIESCPKVGNGGLQAIGRGCRLLKSVSLADLALVADQGVAGLVSAAGASLEKLKLQHVKVTDASLAVVGYYGRELAELALSGLPLVGERGFWVMGNAPGLLKLRSLSVTSCAVTDVGLGALARGCPALKKLHLRRCIYPSDAGLTVLAAAAAGSLETLSLEECNRVTVVGVLGVLASQANKRLKSLELAGCVGVKDLPAAASLAGCAPCLSLRSLSVSRCPGFGDSGLALVGKLCPRLQQISLSGLAGVTEAGLIPLFESCQLGLDEVVLSGCANVTDAAVSALVERHGGTLQSLALEGCARVTDAGLVAVADRCILLENLDLTKCAVGDEGVTALAAAAVGVGLQVLSLSGCSRISPKGLQQLTKLDHSLQGLNLQMCAAISRHAISSLQKKMPLCDILG